MKIEVLYFGGCPNALPAVDLVRRCLAQLGLEVSVVERDGDYPSPSVRVDGRDVMGEPASDGRCCRLDRPTEARVLEALRAAVERGAT
jgi:hypothetical protein